MQIRYYMQVLFVSRATDHCLRPASVFQTVKIFAQCKTCNRMNICITKMTDQVDYDESKERLRQKMN